MDKQGVWILYLCRRDGSDDPSLLALNKAGGCLPQAHVRACRLVRRIRVLCPVLLLYNLKPEEFRSCSKVLRCLNQDRLGRAGIW